ncbi:unnamed protein product [Protopolystoma xenopodis]|uniref:Uncharacterized protein n=1 Tax=Protopolystoma xenopodis TaxID=117903 RepID=A0A448XR38_9PLAT|nr:unnamed protein product [Protopolystoma xenopodis]
MPNLRFAHLVYPLVSPPLPDPVYLIRPEGASDLVGMSGDPAGQQSLVSQIGCSHPLATEEEELFLAEVNRLVNLARPNRGRRRLVGVTKQKGSM